MCAPLGAGLLIASSVASAAAAGVGALAANAQSRYQAKIAERNAAMEREAAQQDMQNTRDAALEHYRNVGQLKGAQRARAAAGGVSLDSGTAAGMLSDTDMLAREDVDRIYKQGAQTVRGRGIAASNYTSQAAASRMAGTASLVTGALSAGSSLLGAARQFGGGSQGAQSYSRGYDGIY